MNAKPAFLRITMCTRNVPKGFAITLSSSIFALLLCGVEHFFFVKKTQSHAFIPFLNQNCAFSILI